MKLTIRFATPADAELMVVEGGWAVLDWNPPAHKFYRARGAVAKDEWTVWRLDGDALLKIARE
jgi:hypothetical protein